MHELVRTNDIVLLGAIEALLASANLDCLIADQHISALEGMIGAFPRRLLVREAAAPATSDANRPPARRFAITDVFAERTFKDADAE